MKQNNWHLVLTFTLFIAAGLYINKQICTKALRERIKSSRFVVFVVSDDNNNANDNIFNYYIHINTGCTFLNYKNKFILKYNTTS